ncbi:ABC transporter permease subunit [Kocuria sp.]|uniref:ABC transporter permease n=1 Tax=Kocuria sp. TaxID=1871328 RepID=UPI0028AF7468|nr:ABC transporter permease [Kocuria sp.]
MNSISTGAPNRRGFDLKNFAANNGALIGLIVLAVIMAIASPAFLSGQNLINIGEQVATIAILAFGMTFVIVAAGIDLSVGSVAALSAMASASMVANWGLPDMLTIVLGLAVGAVTGAVTGIAAAYGKLPAFIASLAMMSVARGLTMVISDGRPVEAPRQMAVLGGELGGIPVPIVVLIIAGLIATFILRFTVAGAYMYAVGGNIEAARLSGIPVKRIVVFVFVLSGAFAGLAGMVTAGRLDSVQPTIGTGAELDAIAAVVIGGASLSGGVGRISGTLVGALVLAVIRNGLNLLNVSPFWQQVVIGVVIAIAVLFDVIRRKNARL